MPFNSKKNGFENEEDFVARINNKRLRDIDFNLQLLIENKMPRDMIINFLKYHYADGTTNGKGLKRVSALEYKKIIKMRLMKLIIL